MNLLIFNALSWEQRKFSDITYPSGEKNRDNLPYESYSITNESGFVPQDEKFENGGTMRDADKRMYYIVSPQSFAYNPARINVGSIGYQNTSKNVIVSSLYEIFKTTEEVDDRFLWHWFKSDDFQKLIVQLQEGGVRLYFYYDKLCMGSIALPSLAEQQRIGAYLDKLDNLITLHQSKAESWKNKKNQLSTISWEQRKLSDFAIKAVDNRGKTPPLSEEGTHPLIEVAALGNGNPDYSKVEKYLDDYSFRHNLRDYIKEGDILFSTVGSIGLVSLMDSHENAVIAQNIVAFRAKQGYLPKFLYSLFSTAENQERANRIVMGAVQPSIKVSQLVDVEYYVTNNIKEQRMLGEMFYNLDNLITLHHRKLNRTQICINRSFLYGSF